MQGSSLLFPKLLYRPLTVTAPIGAARVRVCEKIEPEKAPFCGFQNFDDYQSTPNTFL
jgi:hypothetical protein